MKKTFISLIIACILFSCSENNSSNNETVTKDENQKPDDLVRAFIEDLGTGNFKSAFEKSKVEDWGDFEKFSSVNSFGGIIATKIDKIESKPDENGLAVVYVEAFYSDKENGDNTFKQDFFLQQFGGQWKIVKMKLKGKATKLQFKKYDAECRAGSEIIWSRSIELPQNNEKLKKSIMKIYELEKTPGKDAQEKLNNLVGDECKSFEENMKECIEQGLSFQNYMVESNVGISVLFNNEKVVTMKYVSAGIIHSLGQYHVYYMNYDVETGKQIKFDDIIQSEYISEVKKLILRKLDMESIIENFKLDNKGITFCNDYLQGDECVTILYSELEGKFTEYFANKFGLKFSRI